MANIKFIFKGGVPTPLEQEWIYNNATQQIRNPHRNVCMKRGEESSLTASECLGQSDERFVLMTNDQVKMSVNLG